jgi:hypothetical protein
VDKILAEGEKKAEIIAKKTLARVQKVVGLSR